MGVGGLVDGGWFCRKCGGAEDHFCGRRAKYLYLYLRGGGGHLHNLNALEALYLVFATMPSSTGTPLGADAGSKTSVKSADLSTKLPRLTPRRRAPAPSNPLPVPTTPSLPPPPDLSKTSFTRPTRRILSPQDHRLFLASDTYILLLAFIFSLTESVQDTKISEIQRDNLSPLVRNVSKILDEIEDRVRSCPPEDQGGSRFGNPVFRVFVDKIAEASDGWQARLGIEDAGAREEAGTYFQHAFGNRTRIDYGSGHELNFVVWLYVVSLDRFRLMWVVC